MHFPNSGDTQELAAPAAALLGRRPDWRLATKVVTYRRVEWAIDSFAPYKKVQVQKAYSQLCCNGLGRCHPAPGQNLSCLSGDWLCSSHMVTGEGSVYTYARQGFLQWA